MKKRKEMNSYKSSWQVWEYFSSFSFTHRIYESTVGPRASRTWTTSTLALGVVLQCSPLQSAGCLTPRERSALRTKGTCPLETHSTLVDHTLGGHFLSVGPKPTYDDFYVPFLQTSVRDSCFRGVWMELGFLGCRYACEVPPHVIMSESKMGQYISCEPEVSIGPLAVYPANIGCGSV